MSEEKFVVGLCLLDLTIPGPGSLKEKRHVVKGLVTKIRNSFNISVAEVGNHDLWQRTSLGFCLAGNDRRFVDTCLNKMVDFVQKMHSVTILSQEREIISY